MNDETKKLTDPRLKFSFKRGQRTYYQCSNCHKLSYSTEEDFVDHHSKACNLKFKRDKNSDTASTCYESTTSEHIDSNFKKTHPRGSIQANLVDPDPIPEKKTKNDFKHFEIYTCPDCGKKILGKNFHRHIDECKESKFEKEICEKCRHECVKKIFDKDGNIYHLHRCSRKIKTVRPYRPILKKSMQRRRQRANRKAIYISGFDLPVKQTFTLFQTAKILNTENNLRKQIYSNRLKYFRYIGNLYEALDTEYQIVSHALYLNCFDPNLADKYFECCGFYHNFLKGNIHHMLVKKEKKNLMASDSIYLKEYNELHHRVKEIPEVFDAYLLSCRKKKLYKLIRDIEVHIKDVQCQKRIDEIEEMFRQKYKKYIHDI